VSEGPTHEQPEAWISVFEIRQAIYDSLRREVQFALETAIERDELRVHSCISRVKSLKSFREKVARKRYTDPLSDMHDIVGARVVCLFPDDLAKIDAMIRNEFQVLSSEDKTKTSPPEFMHYRSVHYNCQIRPAHTGPRYDPIKDIVFEVQCRTILQDAWAAVQHYLAYKGPNSIPDDLSRDFSALAGLFHVADKTFQQLYYSALQQDIEAQSRVLQATAAARGEGTLPVAPDVGIDRSTVKALLRQLYADRDSSPDGEYSTFVEELASAGVIQINKLRDLLLQGQRKAEESEQRNPPVDDVGNECRCTDVRFARESMEWASP
jgi:ppGpp synthetase/RelA/SpoT-type nucleotidyltranferase